MGRLGGRQASGLGRGPGHQPGWGRAGCWEARHQRWGHGRPTGGQQFFVWREETGKHGEKARWCSRCFTHVTKSETPGAANRRRLSLVGSRAYAAKARSLARVWYRHVAHGHRPKISHSMPPRLPFGGYHCFVFHRLRRRRHVASGRQFHRHRRTPHGASPPSLSLAPPPAPSARQRVMPRPAQPSHPGPARVAHRAMSLRKRPPAHHWSVGRWHWVNPRIIHAQVRHGSPAVATRTGTWLERLASGFGLGRMRTMAALVRRAVEMKQTIAEEGICWHIKPTTFRGCM